MYKEVELWVWLDARVTVAYWIAEDRTSTTHFYFTISKNKNFKPSPGDLNHVLKISNFPTPRDFGLIVLLTVPWTCHMIQTQDFPKKKPGPKQTLDPNKNRLP